MTPEDARTRAEALKEPLRYQTMMLEAIRLNVPEFVGVLEQDSGPYFRALEDWFPLSGSKIDWRRVPQSIDRDLPDADWQTYSRACVAMVDELIHRGVLRDQDEVVLIGDGPDDTAISMGFADLRRALPDLVALPQHTYVINRAERWCLAFTMEGSLSFGRAPSA